MRLAELEPSFLKIIDAKLYQHTDELAGADGVTFLCPKCFRKNGGPIGTHWIVCWAPHVPQSHGPVPGRWNLVGSGYNDLTLVAGSSSILLTAGCRWHGLVQNGAVIDAGP